jgi:hypothetical protein
MKMPCMIELPTQLGAAYPCPGLEAIGHDFNLVATTILWRFAEGDGVCSGCQIGHAGSGRGSAGGE